jgi:hypothetical protein
MVHIDPVTDKKGELPNDFMCHPQAAPPAPNAGPASGVKGTLSLSCKFSAEKADWDNAFDIVLTADTLTIKGEATKATGAFDAAYKPKTNTSFVRYTVSSSLFENYSSDVLVEKTVLGGGSGKIKLEATGESFESADYDCSPK